MQQSRAGLQYLKIKDYDNAIKTFDKEIARNPRSYITYNYKGNIFFELTKYDESIECYDRPLIINQILL
jgi:tetratricopeptide (TPR) repeat protein